VRLAPLHSTIRVVFLLGSALVALAAPLAAQNFDTSGTASLTGPYLFRYTTFFNDESGNLSESCSLTGIMTFNGTGNYTLSNTQLFDSFGTNGGDCSSLGGGTYGVESNGITQLDNPLFPATLFGTFSQPVLTASSTEDDYYDLLIAVQAPSTPFSDTNLSGNFTVGTLDFLNASAAMARQGYFTMNADGNGNIAAFTVTGSAENLSSGSAITQSVAASTYALAGTAGGTVTFPGSYGAQSLIVSGEKVLYVSADGNWFVGGSTTGSDMLFGFRAPSGTSSNSLLSGTYFMAGMEDYMVSSPSPENPSVLDSFYGSVNANGSGTLIWHERYDNIVPLETFDNTFYTAVTIGANGSYYDGSRYTYLAGANGTALMLIGSNQQFSLIVGVHAPSVTPISMVWIDPIGIINAANYTPITNSYAPGELVSLFGNFGVTPQSNPLPPFPTELGGVQVFVNGREAPITYVSSSQINLQMPFEVSGDYFATFQASVNGSNSNTVTVYVDNSAPGIFALAENGIGPGSILHANYSEVSATSPAVSGETVLLYMTGLGNVTPAVADGGAAPSSPLSYSDEFGIGEISVFLNDTVNPLAPANVTFAGLAPGWAGLDQVNFTLPEIGLENGNVYIQFRTGEAINEIATISVSGFATTSSASSGGPRTAGRHRAIGPGALPHSKAGGNSHRRRLRE
jgi:uncharacterized protein (TIGR03437 family)